MHYDTVEQWVRDFVCDYPDQRGDSLVTRWRTPLVGVATSTDPLFETFKTAVHEKHLLPRELLPEARSVIVFYLPFTGNLHRENFNEARYCSRSWAAAYAETNRLIADTSAFLREKLEAGGEACGSYTSHP